MGNTFSTQTQLTATPASSLFNYSEPKRPRRNASRRLSAYPRRSIFPPDENEPDDFTDSRHDGVLVGWTRTEQGFVIPQIRSLPTSIPLDDTIFNSPRPLPWLEQEKRSRSPVPSARSIPRMRQFSVESMRSIRRELRVVNDSRPGSAMSMEEGKRELHVVNPSRPASAGSVYEGRRHSRWARMEDHGYDSDSDSEPDSWQERPDVEEQFHYVQEQKSLQRHDSTHDSGYSTMAADALSDSTVSFEPYGWEEAAGYASPSEAEPSYYSPTITTFKPSLHSPPLSPTLSTNMPQEVIQYLNDERQESAYISQILKKHPFDEWEEWRTTVTNLLMIPEEEEPQIPSTPITRPITPPPPPIPSETPRSPSRRKSIFNFAKVISPKNVLNKRKSVLW